MKILFAVFIAAVVFGVSLALGTARMMERGELDGD